MPAVDAPAGDDSFVDHSGDWSGEAVGADPRDRFSTRTAGSGRRRAATRNVVPLLALVVLIAVGCGMAWWFVRTPSASAGAVGSAARQGSVQATSESPVGDLTPTQPLATSPALTDAQWTAALTTLDGAREQAYDQRRPDLLTHVYVAGNLLSTDVAQLRRIVPAGCGLAGARTSFTVEQISRRAGSAELVVSATLARSTLRCHGRTSGSAPGTAATRLRIDLVETADGPRIRGEARMT